LKRDENANKEKVRVRDRTCRFPFCICKQWNLFLEVSHREHKGMGGDPSGERSLPELMILVCNWRHKESPISIDKKQIRAVPLTAAGTNGPVAWEVKDGFYHWRELAREVEPGRIGELSAWARDYLDDLAREMLARFT
jgi:hypothetical protein